MIEDSMSRIASALERLADKHGRPADRPAPSTAAATAGAQPTQLVSGVRLAQADAGRVAEVLGAFGLDPDTGDLAAAVRRLAAHYGQAQRESGAASFGECEVCGGVQLVELTEAVLGDILCAYCGADDRGDTHGVPIAAPQRHADAPAGSAVPSSAEGLAGAVRASVRAGALDPAVGVRVLRMLRGEEPEQTPPRGGAEERPSFLLQDLAAVAGRSGHPPAPAPVDARPPEHEAQDDAEPTVMPLLRTTRGVLTPEQVDEPEQPEPAPPAPAPAPRRDAAGRFVRAAAPEPEPASDPMHEVVDLALTAQAAGWAEHRAVAEVLGVAREQHRAAPSADAAKLLSLTSERLTEGSPARAAAAVLTRMHARKD